MHGIVDSHVHLWNPQLLRYAWLDGLPQLNRPFLPDDFAAASSGAGVTKMMVVEAGCEAAQAIEEVDWIGVLAKRERRICGIVANAALEQGSAARDQLLRLSSRPLVRGVRRLLQGEPDERFCLRPEFIAGVELLAEFHFTLDLCIRHEQLPAATELVQRVPQVQFVLDHFGKPPVKAGQIISWAERIKALAALPNVSCKISGLTTEADWERWRAEDLKPYFDVAFGAFGAERVLFGSDWPVCTLATTYNRWIETVSRLAESFTEAGRTKLFQSNAERIYRI